MAWMKGDRAAAANLLETGTIRERSELPKRLGRWQVDPALSALRGESATTAPNEPERRSLREFWSEVESLMQKARTTVTRDVPSRTF